MKKRKRYKLGIAQAVLREYSPAYNLWAREDSNLHGLPRWLLKPVRLPIPPLAPLEI